MMRAVLLVLLMVAVAALVFGSRAPVGGGDAKPVSDLDLGLRRTALTDDRVPAVAVFTEAAPGDNARLPRAYEGAPPLVPHSLEGLLPITAADNMCLLCHQTGSAGPDDPPQLPVSHLTDLRRTPAVVLETVAGARWNCTACHVMQSDAPLLVENRFRLEGR